MILLLETRCKKILLNGRKEETLDRSGVLIQNKRGTFVPNPLIAVVDTLERRQLAVIRSMSLNQQHADPRTLNAAAKVASNSRNVIDYFEDDDLIATPQRTN